MILQELDDNQILSVTVSADKSALVFTEACDCCFVQIIEKKDVYKLIDELKMLADSLSDEPQPVDPPIAFKENLIAKLGIIYE